MVKISAEIFTIKKSSNKCRASGVCINEVFSNLSFRWGSFFWENKARWHRRRKPLHFFHCIVVEILQGFFWWLVSEKIMVMKGENVGGSGVPEGGQSLVW